MAANAPFASPTLPPLPEPCLAADLDARLSARLRFQFVDLLKHIRRQTLNTLKVLCHKSSLASLTPRLCHQIAAN